MTFKNNHDNLTAWKPEGVNRLKGISIQSHPVLSMRDGKLLVYLDEPGKHSVRIVKFDDLYELLSKLEGSDLLHEGDTED